MARDVEEAALVMMDTWMKISCAWFQFLWVAAAFQKPIFLLPQTTVLFICFWLDLSSHYAAKERHSSVVSVDRFWLLDNLTTNMSNVLEFFFSSFYLLFFLFSIMLRQKSRFDLLYCCMSNRTGSGWGLSGEPVQDGSSHLISSQHLSVLLLPKHFALHCTPLCPI